MSLNRALGELFKAIREEAARNPEFAARLGDAIAIYKPPKRRKSAPAPAPILAAPVQPFDLAGALARAPGGRGDAASDPARPQSPGDDHDLVSGALVPEAPPPGAPVPGARASATPVASDAAAEPERAASINPISFFSREGEAALRRELTGAAYSRDVLARLAAEHNLDPAGLAAGADKSGLIEQIVSGAKRRVARDKALFDY